MRCLLLFLVALLKVGTLKTETIDFTRKNGRMDVMFPLGQGKAKDMAMSPSEKLVQEGEPMMQRDWIDGDFKFPPNGEIGLRKIVGVDDAAEEYEGEDNEFPDDQFKSIEQLDDAQAARLSNYLIKFLQRPGMWETPLILVKDTPENLEARPYPMELDGLQGIAKRSRYYRRYPWKRQNSRSYSSMDYDPYNPCNPTKTELFRLLEALHDARQGNKSRYVNFCNRKRPASAVYTNIRFLGRRRK